MEGTTPPTPSDSLQHWVEIHFDDEVLSSASHQWPQARQLAMQLAAIADEQGAKLSLRFRLSFARHAIHDSILQSLVARGHEVGAHAHGRGLAPVVAALKQAGISPDVAAPGLVQAGAGGRALLVRQAAGLGIGLLTDHGAQRAWAYEGLHSRTEDGVVVAAPTVRPFDWGLMSLDGTRHGLRLHHVDRLQQLAAQAASHGAQWFGWTIHEHDLCRAGTLTAREDALAAFRALLSPRVVTAQQAITGGTPAKPQPIKSPSDQRIRATRAIFAVRSHLQKRIPRPRRPNAIGHRDAPTMVTVGQRSIALERLEPMAPPHARLLLCHAGREGGRRLRLKPFGLSETELLKRGWSVWMYDRSGTGDSPPAPAPTGWRHRHPLAPGNPVHTDDWQAVLAMARQDDTPIVALSWSSGIVPVLRAAVGGQRPDALVDGEAPADRWSLVPPRPSELAALDPWDDSQWAGWEPLPLMATLQCPYARLQGGVDHVHDQMHAHARRMVHAANTAGQPVHPHAVWAGKLHAHAERIVDVLDWAAAEAVSARR